MKKILLVIMLISLVCLGTAYADYRTTGVVNTEIPLSDVWSDGGDSLNVGVVSLDVAPLHGTGFVAGYLTCDAGATGTAVNLSGDSIAVKELIISPNPDNGGKIYLAPSAALATSLQRYPMALSDDPIILKVDNVQDVWIKFDVAGEGVNWIGITK